MGIKTEDMVSYLPPKEITENVDWLSILDSFDPSLLYQRFIDECARRNPYETCYKWDTPPFPIERCLEETEHSVIHDRKNLEDCVRRIEEEGLTAVTYKNARAALIRAIGSKGAHEYNYREYERLGEAGRRRRKEVYIQWEQEWKEQHEREAEYSEDTGYFGYDYPEYCPVSMHEKVVKIRKGLKGSNGKPLVQRDFAKLLDYPINKYAEAEKTDRYGRGEEESPVEWELLEKLVMIAHANPYWLFDSDCEAFMAEENPDLDVVRMGDAPCVYASPDIILKWIKEGKPKETFWDSVFFEGEQ